MAFFGNVAVVIDADGSAFITKAEFDSLKNNFQAQIDNYNSSIDSKIDGAIASYLSGIKMNSEEDWVDLYTSLSMAGSTYTDATYGPLKWNASNTSDKNKNDKNKYEVEAHFFQSGMRELVAPASGKTTHIYGRYVWNKDEKNKRLILDSAGKIKSFSDFLPKVQTVISFPVWKTGGVCGPLGSSSWSMVTSTWGYETAIGYIGEITRPSCSIGPIALYWKSWSYTPTSINFYTERIIDQDTGFTIQPRSTEAIYTLDENTSTKTAEYTTTSNVKIINTGTEAAGVFKLTNQTLLWDQSATYVSEMFDPRSSGGCMDQKFIEYMYGCASKTENDLEVASWESQTGETFRIKHGLPLFKAQKNADVKVKVQLEGAGWVYIYKSTERDTWGGNYSSWNNSTKKLGAGAREITVGNVNKDDVYYFIYLPETGNKGIKIESIVATVEN